MNYEDNYFKGHNDVFNLDLTNNEKLVLLLLMRYENNSKNSFPSYKLIADKCSISRQTAITCIKKLNNKGIIAKTIRRIDECKNTSNIYVVQSFDHLVKPLDQPSQTVVPNKEVFNKELFINNNILHQTKFDVCLNTYSLERFNRPLRKSNKVVDIEDLEDYEEEEFIEFLDDNITCYDQCNYDYIETIQARAR